jgi:hypothetical protein
LSAYVQRMRDKNLPARWPRVRVLEADLPG